MANTTINTGAAKEMRERMYTVRDAAKALKLSESTVRMYCYLGQNPNHSHHGVRLEAVKIGQSYLIAPESIEAYRKMRRSVGRPKADPVIVPAAKIARPAKKSRKTRKS